MGAFLFVICVASCFLEHVSHRGVHVVICAVVEFIALRALIRR